MVLAECVGAPTLLQLTVDSVARLILRLLSASLVLAMDQLRRGRVVVTALVLAVLVAPPVEGRGVVRLAVIAPADRDHEQSLFRVLPAVQLAVRKVADPITGTLPGWDIRVDHRDSRCSSTFGPLAAFDFYINRSAGTTSGSHVPVFKRPRTQEQSTLLDCICSVHSIGAGR